MVNMDSLHAVVVPLEPSVTAGYHPCLSSDLQRELLYSAPLGLLIRESPQLPDVLTAAVLALFTESVLKVMVIFFFIGVISGIIIWSLERHKKGVFPDATVFPIPFINGIDAGFYWALTTATSTGYGDKYPVSSGGRIWAMVWMVSCRLISELGNEKQ